MGPHIHADREFVVHEVLWSSVLFFDALLQNIVMIFLFQSVKKTNQINRFFNIDDDTGEYKCHLTLFV